MKYEDKNLREAVYALCNESGGGGGDYDQEIEELQNRATALESDVADLKDDIDATAADLASLEGRTAASETAISAERTSRADADTQLASDIASETSTREAADTSLASDIASETSAREAADTELAADIASETSAREAADTALAADIASETSAREAADTALSADIASETSAREAADEALSDRIDAIHGIDYYVESFSIVEIQQSYIQARPCYLEGIIVDEDTYLNGIVVGCAKNAGSETGKVWVLTANIQNAAPSPKTLVLNFTSEYEYTVEIFPTDQLDFMLYDFNQTISTNLLPIGSSTAIDTPNGRIDINLPAEMSALWKIASVAKYELKKDGSRIDAIMCYEFSMNQQSTMRCGFRTSGTAAKTVDTISGALILSRRA